MSDTGARHSPFWHTFDRLLGRVLRGDPASVIPALNDALGCTCWGLWELSDILAAAPPKATVRDVLAQMLGAIESPLNRKSAKRELVDHIRTHKTKLPDE